VATDCARATTASLVRTVWKGVVKLRVNHKQSVILLGSWPPTVKSTLSPSLSVSLHREVVVLLKIRHNEENLDISEKPKKTREKWQNKQKKTYHWCGARNGIKLEKETGGKADTKTNSRTKLAIESEHKTTEKNLIVAELENNRLLNSKSV
jgi:hypothetical protein